MEPTTSPPGQERNAGAPAIPPTILDFRPPNQPSRSGRRLVAGYEVMGELGQGGMGVVYLARQVQLDRLVALKMIRSSHADREELIRFRTEAEAVARLHHPNIVQIHEIGEHDGEPFFSLEFCPGGTLDRYLDSQPLPPRRAAQLVQTLASAVQHAHDHGVVHRDLKPGNVLLSEDNGTRRDAEERGSEATIHSDPRSAAFASLTPRITDFGLAKCLDGPAGMTRVGAIIGTPPYMAPEQASGQNEQVGPATDVYALGAIFYECLSGRPPFQSNSVLETLEQIRRHDPVSPRALNPAVPRDLETICLTCLRKEPSRRYPSARALADDLGRWAGGEPIWARPVGPLERTIKWGRRRPTAAALVAVSLVLLAVLAAALPLHIARLRARVAEASDRAVRAHLRAEGERRLAEGQQALAANTPRNLEAARALFATVAEDVSAEAARADRALADLRDKAVRWEQRARSLLARQAGRERARHLARRCQTLRDEAFFELHRDLVAGPVASNASKSRELARKSLSSFPDPDCLPPDEAGCLRRARQELLFMLAEATARAGDRPAWREALGLLDRAGPGAAPHSAHKRRARYLDLLGRHEEAQRSRSQAARTAPAGALDWFLTGLDRWQAGDVRAALDAFDRALAEEPELFWARFFRGLACQQLGRPTQARATLRQCARARPGFAWPHLLSAYLNIQANLMHSAEADLARAERCLLDRAARYVLLTNRGALALKRKRPDLAIPAFQYALLLLPDRYHAHANLAQAYWQRGQTDSALSTLDHAVRLAPGHPELYRLRASLHRDGGRPTLALRDLERAIELTAPGRASDLSADHRERARLLYTSQRYDLALTACRAALKLSPGDAVATRLEAECLLELAQPRDALAAFDRYLKTSKPDVELHRRRARARASLGDFAGVVGEYSAALAIRRDAPLLTARGWAYLVNAAARPALHDFEAALALGPGSADALTGRGAARVELGAWQTGSADAEEALRCGPRSPRLLYKVARVLARAAAVAPADRRRADRSARALAVLRDAVLAVPAARRALFWQEQVRRDSAFAALARTDSFARLERQFAPVPPRPAGVSR